MWKQAKFELAEHKLENKKLLELVEKLLDFDLLVSLLLIFLVIIDNLAKKRVSVLS